MEEGLVTPPITPNLMDHNQTPSESVDQEFLGAPMRPRRFERDHEQEPANHHVYRRLNFF